MADRRVLAGAAAAVVALALGGCSSSSAVSTGPSTTSGATDVTTGGTASQAAAGTPSTPSVGASGAGGTLPATGPDSASPAASGPTGTSGGTASGSVPAAARLDVTLALTSPAGARAVAVTAEAKGLVPQVLDGAGQPVAAGQTEVMGTSVRWGDGETGGSDPGDVSCSAGGALVPLAETFDLTHTYARAGRYTVTFTAGACPPLKDASRTLVVTVR